MYIDEKWEDPAVKVEKELLFSHQLVKSLRTTDFFYIKCPPVVTFVTHVFLLNPI